MQLFALHLNFLPRKKGMWLMKNDGFEWAENRRAEKEKRSDIPSGGAKEMGRGKER